MAQEDTCGTGMAAQSEFPALLADCTATMAEVVRFHTQALDTDEPNAAAESQAWNEVAEHGSDITSRLRDLARRMSECHDVPGAAHDLAVLTSPEAVRTFQDYAAAQRALRDRLNQAVAENDAMLQAMGGENAPE